MSQIHTTMLKEYKTLIAFSNDFRTEKDCLEYLCDQKWKDGFCCRKCAHTEYGKGKKWYYRRCLHCRYDESATSHTHFHKIKFSLVAAFWICYQLGTLKKGLSTCEISRQYDITQKSAWFFKRKIQQAIDNRPDEKLRVNVEVDEFVVGGAETGMPGRSHGKKAKVQVAIEVDYPAPDYEPIIKNAAARVIGSYDAGELKRGIDEMVDDEAVIVTDQWSAYPKATKGRWHISFPSDKGKNFVLLHWHIFNLKNWLRGIHHKVSIDHLQRYLNEYHYRFNRRHVTEKGPMGVLRRMSNSPWLPYQIAMAP